MFKHLTHSLSSWTFSILGSDRFGSLFWPIHSLGRELNHIAVIGLLCHVGALRGQPEAGVLVFDFFCFIAFRCFWRVVDVSFGAFCQGMLGL